MDFDGLNEDQLEAVKETQGYVRVVAGAGSGKTKTLIARYLYLVREKNVPADRILCLTFTRKAAGEMRKRVKEEIEDINLSSISTYHSFCSSFLREEIFNLGYLHGFRIYDEQDQKKVVGKIIDMKPADIDRAFLSSFQDMLFSYKIKETYIPRMMDRNLEDQIVEEDIDSNDLRYIEEYLESQRKGRWLDFNDLILYTHYLLTHDEEVASRWKNRFDYIEVDEAQDSSKPEYEIIEILASGCKNLFIVGDPDQNIYEWRRSSPSFLLDFDKVHKDCKTFVLTKNYRSGKDLLAASNNLIKNNKNRIPKELEAVKEESDKVTVVRDTFQNCMNMILQEVSISLQKGNTFRDNAVFYRCRFMSQNVEDYLRQYHVPYQVIGDVSFYDTAVIKDVTALIELVLFDDDESFERMANKPRRRFGKKKLEYLESVQKEGESLFKTLTRHIEDEKLQDCEMYEFIDAITNARIKTDSGQWGASDAVNYIIKDTGYLDYVSNLKRMLNRDDLDQFLKSVDDFSNHTDEDTLLNYYQSHLNEDEERSRDCIQLMTIHASKGLEFSNVYVIDCNEDSLPYKRADERGESGLEEERRLFYVAMTRTKEKLFLFNCLGNTQNDKPSSYIEEIDCDSVIRIDNAEDRPAKKTTRKEKPKSEGLKTTKAKDENSQMLDLWNENKRTR